MEKKGEDFREPKLIRIQKLQKTELEDASDIYE